MLNLARKHQKTLFTLADSIYMPNEEYDLFGLEIKPKLIEMDTDNASEHDVVFDEIKDTIVQGIRNAKYTIWIAIAWFTDEDIFRELLMKKNEGINIRIITSGEESNTYLIQRLESNFEVTKIPMKGKYLSNRLHDKFCIIDFEFVMHGSYNWSKAAQYNDETLATALDKDFVKKFADEFMRLYNENH
jgi:phosphatidylserine/phosphatidylglycerophosphate/cardiolipin synthase-like enzyme